MPDAPILQQHLPQDMRIARGLPGIQPCAADDWLRVDEAYGGQMQARLALLDTQREAVHFIEVSARPAAVELLDMVLELLPRLGFQVLGDDVLCPDGRQVRIARDAPLVSLGQLVQQDLCIMEKRGDEHVLTGAVVCFPASWKLSEKAGRPLLAIHTPVPEYDAGLAKRVQRLFDGIQPGRPLWRMNQLWYADATLHQPRSVTAPRPVVQGEGADDATFYRSERQCLVRLPKTRAVVFAIHTHVLRAQDVDLSVAQEDQ